MMDARTQAMFEELSFHLQNATNRCVNLRGELAARDERIAELEEQIKSKEAK